MARSSRFSYELGNFPTLIRSNPMKKLIAIALAGALALPLALSSPQPAAAQDPFAGALFGGLLGAGLGAVVGGRRGLVAGAIIGTTTGAIVGSQIRPGYAGYFWSENRCWYQYPNGQVVRAPRRQCY
jgi:Na+/proline symporter